MIVGININSIKAVSNMDEEHPKGNISVDTTPSIDDVEKKDVLEMKDLLSAKFSFRVNYEPNVGSIRMEGEVLYKTDDTKNIIKKWKENKNLESDLAVEMLNAIFRVCLTKAITIAGDLRLPPPVRFPIVKKGGEKEE